MTNNHYLTKQKQKQSRWSKLHFLRKKKQNREFLLSPKAGRIKGNANLSWKINGMEYLLQTYLNYLPVHLLDILSLTIEFATTPSCKAFMKYCGDKGHFFMNISNITTVIRS